VKDLKITLQGIVIRNKMFSFQYITDIRTFNFSDFDKIMGDTIILKWKEYVKKEMLNGEKKD
jgi:hypothetical protein